MSYLKRISSEELERVTPRAYKKKKEVSIKLPLGEGDWALVIYQLALFLGVLLLLFRSFELQVVNGRKNFLLSLGNSVRSFTLRAERGVLYDRNGLVIVRNKPAFSIELNTRDCQKKCGEIVEEIAKYALVNKEYVYEQLLLGSKQIVVVSNLGRDELLEIEGKIHLLDGVSIQIDPIRDYTSAQSFAHLVGYIGEGDFGEKVGRYGLEQKYEKYLHGVAGSRLLKVDSTGSFLEEISVKKPIPGKSLFLTIDKRLQEVSFEVLKKAMLEKKATGGAVVATNPRNGGVLALVSFPSFDPSSFAVGMTKAEFAKLSENPTKPFFNRSISALYPPGSTFKMVTALSALEEGVISGTSLVECPSFIQVGSFVFRDWYSGGRGPIDVKRALQVSCDTFFYTVGGGFGDQKGVGIEKIAGVARKLGFAKKSGIDLDGESSGTVPDSSWKRSVKNEDWYLGDTYISSIGQGYILATPLQVNLMTAFFASRGKLYKPRIVSRIEDGESFLPELLYEYKGNFEYIDTIREGMKMAVTAGGTAYPLFDFEKRKGVVLGGKTGTAEFGNPVEFGGVGKTHAWFSVFGPFENANIVLTVLLEGGGSGSTDAAPVAKEILDEWFK
ncbi:MAG: penicillin-binding protein 2 [Patescibacteria group bacterium]